MDASALVLILENTQNWHVAVRERTRAKLKKMELLVGQANFTTTLTEAQAAEIGEEVELYVRDMADAAHRVKETSRTLLSTIFFHVLSQVNWTEIGYIYWSKVLEGDFGILGTKVKAAA